MPLCRRRLDQDRLAVDLPGLDGGPSIREQPSGPSRSRAVEEFPFDHNVGDDGRARAAVAVEADELGVADGLVMSLWILAMICGLG